MVGNRDRIVAQGNGRFGNGFGRCGNRSFGSRGGGFFRFAGLALVSLVCSLKITGKSATDKNKRRFYFHKKWLIVKVNCKMKLDT